MKLIPFILQFCYSVKSSRNYNKIDSLFILKSISIIKTVIVNSKMSRRVQSNNKNVRVKEARAMLCTHCKNMGEPKAVYEGHAVRDLKGLISCPKIKKNVCNNCKKTGHLSSHCTFVKSEHRSIKSENKVAVMKSLVLNRFSDLADSDSDDEPVVPLIETSSGDLVVPFPYPLRKVRRDPEYWIELCGDSSDEE